MLKMKSLSSLACAFLMISLVVLTVTANQKYLFQIPFESHSIYCSYSQTNDIFAGVYAHNSSSSISEIYKLSEGLGSLLSKHIVYDDQDTSTRSLAVQEFESGKILYVINNEPESQTDAVIVNDDFTPDQDTAFGVESTSLPSLALLPNGNIAVASSTLTGFQVRVFDDALTVVAEEDVVTSKNEAVSITSYPAGGDGHFTIAVEYADRDGKIIIFDEDANVVNEVILDSPTHDVMKSYVATLTSNDLVIAYKGTFEGELHEVFQIYYTGNSSLSDVVSVAESTSDDVYPYVAPLADSGFVYLYLKGYSLMYRLFDQTGVTFGPPIYIKQSSSQENKHFVCSSPSENVFSVFRSFKTNPGIGSSSIHQFPRVRGDTPLAITKNCVLGALTFDIGGGTIPFLAAREVIAENNYRVLDLTFSGIGTASVSYTVSEDITDKVVEFTNFEGSDDDYGDGDISTATFDFTADIPFTNVDDDSCGCEGPYLLNKENYLCISTSDLTDPSLNAVQNEDDSVSLSIILDEKEADNFAGDINWQVSVSGGTDISGFTTILAAQTGFNVEIPANLFKGDDYYTFTATTSSDRTAEATIAYEVAIVFEEENEEEEEENQEEEDIQKEEEEEEDGEVVEEGFITIEENQDYLISYRLVDKDGSKVEEFETAQTLQFKFIFSIDDEFIQKCFSYGEVEDDIQNYECYGVQNSNNNIGPMALSCPRNVNTGEGTCILIEEHDLEMVSSSFVDALTGNRRILQQQYNRVIISRNIAEDSANIPLLKENELYSSFSFSHSKYELDLAKLSPTEPQEFSFTIVNNQDDSGGDAYDFTKSAAPIAILIIGFLWLALNSVLFYFSRGLNSYSMTESLENSKATKTFFVMLMTIHPLFGIYAYKSPTTSKNERTFLYLGRSIGLMLFVNVFMMDKYEIERFLSSTENSEFTAGFLLLPYATLLPVIYIFGALLRGRCQPKDEPSKIVKLFTIIVISLLILLSFIFTVVIQSNMNEGQRTKTNKAFGQAMFQDLLVTPIVTLILQLILYHIFTKKKDEKKQTLRYALIFESVDEAMTKRRSLKYKLQASSSTRKRSEENVDPKQKQ